MFRILAKSKKNAEILIYGDVGPVFWGDEVSAVDFAKTLKDIGAVETIDLRINSYGGDVFEGMTIYRQLVDHAATVNVHVDGIAASIASVIAMAGDTIRIAESGRMMIHDALTIAIGNADDMRQTADILDQTSEQIAGVYASRIGKGATEIRDAMRAETWFNAKDALAFGLATEIAPNKIAPGAENKGAEIIPLNTAKHKFRNVPPELLSGRGAIAAQVARQQVAVSLSRVAASASKR